MYVINIKERESGETVRSFTSNNRAEFERRLALAKGIAQIHKEKCDIDYWKSRREGCRSE